MAFEFPGPVGRLEAVLDEPHTEPRAAVVFAHAHPQYGGTMHSKVVFHGAKAFQKIGCAVLRFNFRGTGTSDGAFDDGAGEKDDFGAGLEFMAVRYPDVELWAAGFSFGAWIALTVGATNDRVSVLIGIAPPTDHYDFAELRQSAKPKFFVHGEGDEYCSVHAMWRLYGQLPEPKELVVIDAVDHVFGGKTSEVGDAIEDLLGDFNGA